LPRRSLLLAAALCASIAIPTVASAGSIRETVSEVQPRMVKIYGAGGFRGLEAYQSGFLISPDGHVLTVWSYVLDTDYITVVLNDGRKLEGKLLGADPRLELAVLKIEGSDLPHFDLDEAVEAEAGTRVLAFSNLYGVATGNEPASVQHGVISVKTQLAARRGVFETPYNGPVYVLDAATNNPGAAGGALVTRQGKLLGMLGKELRNSMSNTWLNYALPISELRKPVELIREGKFVARTPEENEAAKKPAEPYTLDLLGVVLVPDVMERTPPYIDQVRPGFPAAQANLEPDDLILLVGDRLIQSCKDLQAELEYIDRVDPLRITILRDQDLIEITLQAPETSP
jgi:serine protease Do